MHFPFASIYRNHAASYLKSGIINRTHPNSCPYTIVCPSIILISWRTKCIQMWLTPNVHLIYYQFNPFSLRKIHVVRKQIDKSTKQRETNIEMFSGECGKKIWISSLASHVFLIPSGNLKVCHGSHEPYCSMIYIYWKILSHSYVTNYQKVFPVFFKYSFISSLYQHEI